MTRPLSVFSTIVLSTIALLLQFSTSSSKNLWGKVTPEEWALTAPADYPDAQLIVLMDVCTLHVTADGIRSERYTRYKLLKKEGIDKLNEVGILRDEDDKTVEFKAQTLLPDGRAIKADKKSMFTKSVGDWQVLSVAYPALEPGCIVELKYVGSHMRFGSLDTWYFQSELYTKVSRMTLVLAPGFEFSTLFTNVPADFRKPAEDQMANLDHPAYPDNLFTWERTDMPPVDLKEPYAGFTLEYLASLECQIVKYEWGSSFTVFSSLWERIGNRFFSYIVDPYMYGGNLDKLLESIVPPGQDDMTRMTLICKFVADSTTVMDQAGSRFSNHTTVGDFVKERTGNDFDVSLFLIALLTKANLNTKLVMTTTREKNTLNVDAPMSRQYWDAMVLVEFDSSYVILDPANKLCTPGQISPNFYGQMGLVVEKKGSRLITLGEYQERSYRLDATDMTIDSAGMASCSTTVSMTGSFPPFYGQEHVSRGDSSWVDYFILSRVNDTAKALASHFEFQPDGKLSCWAKYETDQFSRTLENNVFVKPITLRFTENPFSAVRRSFPIDFQFPGTWHNIVTIRFAKEPSDIALPSDVVVEKDGVTFKRVCQRNGSMIVVDSKLVIAQPLYDVKRYAMIKELFDQIATSATDEVSASF